jgi:linoleoyl-CoA desaturase
MSRHVPAKPALGAQHPTFSARKGDFFSTVQARASAYFAERGLRRHASPTAQILSLMLVAAVPALFYPAYVRGSILAAFVLGLIRAVAVLGPGHSMSHLAFFRESRTNLLGFRIIAPLLLTTMPVWRLTHVVHHHLYTLTDADLQDHYPFKRVQLTQARRWWHRYQHLYMWPLYVLGLPVWQALDLTRAFRSLFSHTFLDRPFPLRYRIETLIGQAITVFLYIVLPFLLLPVAEAALIVFIANAVAGLIVVCQIVVNHEVTSTALDTAAHAGSDWGEHQVRTSHNYAPTSPIALHMSGGLNYQVEHHLFPRVYYGHYPALAQIVRATCAEHGLPYYSSATFLDAIGSHYNLLRIMGRPDPTPTSTPFLADSPAS